jgi:hypothetical protein
MCVDTLHKGDDDDDEDNNNNNNNNNAEVSDLERPEQHTGKVRNQGGKKTSTHTLWKVLT